MKIKKISQQISNEIINSRIFDIFSKIKNEGKLEWEENKISLGWHKQEDTNIYFKNILGFIDTGSTIAKKTFSYILNISTQNTKTKVKLRLNKKTSMEDIAIWEFDVADENGKKILKEFLKGTLGYDTFETIEEEQLRNVSKVVRLTRMKRPQFDISATALYIIIEPDRHGGHVVYYINHDLETNKRSEKKVIRDKGNHNDALSGEEALNIMERHIQNAKTNGFYVDDNSLQYIPEGANKDNWDFSLNMWKKDMTESQPQDDKDNKDDKDFIANLFGSNNNWYKTAQNYQGYYGGNIPDYAADYLGGPSVEASQIESMFGKAHEAINLVNRFDASLLRNISFIFNFAKNGAYGVYLSELDRAIKTSALKKKLEQQGYEIKLTQNGLTAYPQKEISKTPEDIQKDIDSLYQDLDSKGGSAIGINMNSVLNAAKSDVTESNFKDPDAWQWIAMLHLGGTIAHEAVHAKGAKDEGPSEQVENNFIQWALPIVNEEYKKIIESKGEQFSPLVITDKIRHASSNKFIKNSQLMGYYFPESFYNNASGSDLDGRFGAQLESERASWSMMAQTSQDVPIEKRLGRQYMSPLPPDLSQEHNSIEEQLRKYTRTDMKLDPHATMTELLSEGYDPDRGYTTLEGLLDEKRPKPLLVPIKKTAANNLIKTATLFGWMNNLSISDGSTIPGLGDRVMAWDDRDEDFSAEESWIKRQPRYNPSYDLKGFYYRWIEPKFQPELFDDMTRDYSNTHPAKRFASADLKDLKDSVSVVLSILSHAKSMIDKNDMCCTRFIITEDLMPLMDKVFVGDNIRVNVFFLDNKNDEELFAVWVCSSAITDDEIERIEKHLQKKSEDKIEDLLEKAFGKMIKKQQEISSDIINKTKNVCKELDVKNIDYQTEDNSLHFTGGNHDQIIKIGSLVAEKIGIINPHINKKGVYFHYNNLVIKYER